MALWERYAEDGVPFEGSSVLRGPARSLPDVPVHVLIEATCEADPVAPAIRCADVVLTRGELLRACRAWSSVLASYGCGPEQPVAMLVPRGTDAVVAILAILRTGSGYLPLSCEDPPERLAVILADCGQPLVVVANDLAGRLDGYPGPVLRLSDLQRPAEATRPAEAPVRVALDNLAFVIYTSGTTGQPKGVEGTHRQLLNYALWCQAAFPHEPGEWLALHAPLSFLGSLTCIFTPLLAGWPIEIAPEGDNVDDLLRLTGTCEVGLLKLTPTHIKMMLARGAAGRRTARMFMIGSEPLVMTSELHSWVDGMPRATFVNHYGLTETHGCFCHWFGSSAAVGEGVPIGKPVANMRAHIVDEYGQGVPRGELGELLVAGDSVGRGYRGKAGLTADRWIPDPHGPVGGRILRTGDLARLRADGFVEVVGRADRQVKIRGHRVEPGAVEHALRARPDVAEALVLPRRRDGTMTLAAYLVPRPGARLDPAAIRRDLAGLLPAPSVPSRMAVLTQFPANANGKVDVMALPEPAPITSAQDEPGGRWTRTELIVADAYASVLGLESAGLHDDFFALGGDSMLAVGVAVEVGRRLGGEVPLPTLGNGTVREYSGEVAAALGANACNNSGT